MRDLLPFVALYRKHSFGLTLGMLLALATLAAAIGLLTLSGWFISASAVAGLTIAKQTFNYMLPGAGVRGFSMLRTAGRWGERVVSHNATFKLLADLRLFVFRKLIPLIPGKHADLRDADLLNRLVADVDAMDHLYLRLLTPLIIGLIATFGLSGFLYWFNPMLGIMLGSILIVLMCVIPIVFYRLGRRQGEMLTLSTATLRVALLDWIQSNTELSLFNAGHRYQQRITDTQEQLLNAQRKMAMITGFASASLQLASGLTLALIVWFAADGINGRAPDPFVAMFAFATLASFEILMPFAGAFQYLGKTLTSAKRLNRLLNAKPDTPFAGNTHCADAIGNIALSNVTFSYHDTNRAAINGVNLEIKAGSKVALLGQTGCGKSTLLQLITRQWDPMAGDIKLDGVSLKEWQEASLRNSMVVVSQRVDLFNGTLRDNLLIANPEASDETLRQALIDVTLNNLLDKQGLDSWIGEGGRQLSGGERRRIGIARAILHNAPIWLLDEPTEGLDKQTEQNLLNMLMDKSTDKTVLFITHRLVGLPQMDTICLMEAGQIVEHGSHQSLLATSARYQQICQYIQ
ncbi:heme ABC transporter ATP-binding protein/permease CydC [Thaumasiovibrio sp. DFM-14]|uniref:heme ABC transporter ATP-binding protein/permease CydC n=1 Tax=Thaumasiovibrio sp. DFM-14 TaxID=3384792 RepID=UPI0039A170DA